MMTSFDDGVCWVNALDFSGQFLGRQGTYYKSTGSLEKVNVK